MAIMCGRACTYNQGGKCLNSVCSLVQQETKIHQEMLTHRNKVTWFMDDGNYFVSVKKLCVYYGINLDVFVARVQQGIPWMSAFNMGIEDKILSDTIAAERAAAADAIIDYGNHPSKDFGIER